jgi:hypothetical protein
MPQANSNTGHITDKALGVYTRRRSCDFCGIRAITVELDSVELAELRRRAFLYQMSVVTEDKEEEEAERPDYRWTAAEDEVIRRHYWVDGAPRVKALLKTRSLKAIRKRASRLAATKEPRPVAVASVFQLGETA